MIQRSIPLAVLSTLVALLAIPASCGSGTGGRIVSIEWAVRGVPEEGRPSGEFVTDLGWEVRLQEAWLAMGPMYAHAAEELARWRRVLSPARALAHPGHDHGFDRVRGEWLEQAAVDVLAPSPRRLGDAMAEAGAVDRLEVAVGPYDGTEGPEALDGATLWVRGEATRDEELVPFEGALTFAEETARAVDHIAAEASLDEGGRLTVGVRPGLWFQGAQFDRLETDGTGPAVLRAGGQVYNALSLGVHNPRAFIVEWVEDGDLE